MTARNLRVVGDFTPEVQAGVDALVRALDPVVRDHARDIAFILPSIVRQVDLVAPERWITPTLLNSWVAFSSTDTAGYYKDAAGFVHLRGRVKSGNFSNTLPMFTLPAGYLPTNEVQLAVVQNNRPGQIKVEAAGNVLPALFYIYNGVSGLDDAQGTNPAAWVSLTGLRFESADPLPAAPVTPYPMVISCADLGKAPTEVVAVKCEDRTGGGLIAATCPTVRWERSPSGIFVNEFVGLLPNRTYRVTLRISGS